MNEALKNLRGLADQVTYKPTWMLEFKLDGSRPYIQWSFFGACAVTGVPSLCHCRKWFVSEHMTDGEFVQTAFAAVLQAEEHEAREFFLFKDKRLFGPHLSLNALMSRADEVEGRA